MISKITKLNIPNNLAGTTKNLY